MRWRVIGLGSPAGGDDRVGLAVVEALRGLGVPAGVEVVAVADPTQLVELVTEVGAVLLVDAVVVEGARPGTLVEASEGDLVARAVRPVSTHGLDAREALGLARAIAPDRVAPRIVVLGVAIDPPPPGAFEMGAAVAAAVGKAARRALELVAAPG